MKVPIVFLAFLGLVCGKPLPISRLQDDLKEFMELVPTDKILEITLDYLAYDQEVKDFFVYIQSEEFPIHKIHTIVEHLKEYKDCSYFINDQGVDLYAIINEIHDILEGHPFQPTNTTRMGVGFYGLIHDVIAVLPLDEFAELLDKKLETRELFKSVVTALKSPVYKKMVDTVRASPEYHELLEILREMVVDVERYTKLLWELFLRGTRTIQEDVKEFMEIFPTDKVLKITLDYLASDPELQEAFVYIQSEEFPKIHKFVEHLKEYKYCLKFITDEGVDVYAIITEVYDILDLPPFQPTNTTRMGVGIYGFIDDVTAVLPLDDLKALFDKKMETREYFKILVTTLRSPVFVEIVDTVKSWPVYHDLLKQLYHELLKIVQEKVVDVDRIFELFMELYGLLLPQTIVDTVESWPVYHELLKPLYYELLKIVREKVVDVDRIFELFRELYTRGTHKLQDILKEFIVLVPTDKVLEITLNYLAYDEEVRKIVVYIQSEEFPILKIHKFVEYLKEYKDCSKFITDQGVDVYAIIKEIYYILEKHPFQPTNTTYMGVGIYGLIHDVIAVLPLDEMTALLDKKLETREFFKTLLTAIRYPGIMKMVDTVLASPEYHELLQILREMVVDVERYIKPLWKLSLRGTRTIQEDVKEFMEIFPTEKVLEITLDYLDKAIVYLQSEEFPKIHTIVENLKEYKYCLKFITDEGVDIYVIVNEIREFLHLPPVQPTNTTRVGIDIFGLIDDVIAVLPLDDLKTYIDKKIETRLYFKILYTPLPVFVNMVDTVQSWPIYHELLKILREEVDVDRIIEYLRVLFGLLPL